jgi:hypothetical protein
MTKEQLQGMLAEGFNLNQIAAIYMISKESLVMLLSEEATKVTPTGSSGKTKVSTIETTSSGGTEGTSGGSGTADRPLFEDEPGL